MFIGTLVCKNILFITELHFALVSKSKDNKQSRILEKAVVVLGVDEPFKKKKTDDIWVERKQKQILPWM